MTKPKDILTDHWFMGSVFQNSECETILRSIILLQKQLDADGWTPFSWEQYKDFCSHGVTESERGVLDVFVNGGRSVPGTSTTQEPGWLLFDDGKYSFTPKMIAMLSEKYTKKEEKA